MTTATKNKSGSKLNSLRGLQTKAQARELAITEKRLDKLAQEALDRSYAHSEELFNRVEEVIQFNADKLRPVLSLDREFAGLKEENRQAVERINGEVRRAYKDMESNSVTVINKLVTDTHENLSKAIEAIRAEHVREYKFDIPDTPNITMTNAHYLMPELLRHIAAGHDTAAIGPSGSGKTHAARQAAEALGKRFFFIACSDDDMSAKWFGYMNPVTGEYVPTQVYEWFSKGGVLLVDEWDNMRGNIGVRLNAMLDNGLGDFPCGPVERHPEAICIASGNTIGRGATRVYRSRNGLDESTIERFDVIEWDYDEDLERKLGAVPEWTEFVIAARHAMTEARLDYVISPRASMKGGRLLLTGLSPEETVKRVVCKSWPEDDYNKVMRNDRVRFALAQVMDWASSQAAA